MSLKDEWKKTGKNVGSAFSNFGKAMGKTMKVAFTDDENKVDENGESELKKAWKDTGKGFGEAGKSFGHATGDTAKAVVDDIDEKNEKRKKKKEDKKNGVVDAEFEEVKEEDTKKED